MKHRRRRGFTAAEVSDVWIRYKRGESLREIGNAVDKDSGSIHLLLARHGGIPPSPRHRSQRSLSMAEREEVSRGIAREDSIRAIARSLGRAPSTVSREISRNGGYHGYRAAQADARAWDRARRPKPCKLIRYPELQGIVSAKLALDWSPQQISGWLKRQYPGDETYHVSHETIYRSLFIQARGALKKELQLHLRKKRSIRRSKARCGEEKRGQLIDTISIRERPPGVEDRAVPGHWEGDLLAGSKNSYIVTLVERHTRYVVMARVAGKDTRTVVDALIREARKLPSELYQSLTWDCGKELADHKRFKLATDIDVYFCDPSSPWQRGSNENTNGLLRQYFPKGTDLSVHSQEHLDWVARRLNERPRQTLEFETPAQRFEACVASTD